MATYHRSIKCVPIEVPSTIAAAPGIFGSVAVVEVLVKGAQSGDVLTYLRLTAKDATDLALRLTRAAEEAGTLNRTVVR